jgi:hypothetical protein
MTVQQSQEFVQFGKTFLLRQAAIENDASEGVFVWFIVARNRKCEMSRKVRSIASWVKDFKEANSFGA